MEYAFLGTTGVRVSRLALGTMSFGAQTDEAEARRMFGAVRDRGVNFFDTANVYAKGRSEEILGRLVSTCRDQVVIATKAYFPTGEDENARGSSRYHLVRAVEASLRRLGTDRIDVFYLHRWDDQTKLEDTLRTVEDLVRTGKVLYPAASNFAAWQTARAIGIADLRSYVPLACIQPMYNLVKRQAEVEILPMAAALGLAVVPYSPLGGGLLTGRYGHSTKPTSGRLVDNAMYRVRYADERYYEIAERFSEIARELGLHPASLAVRWAASHPAVTAPLLGARNLEQLTPTLAALDIPMDEALRSRLSALVPTPPPATDRNEELTEHNYGSR